MHGGTITSGRRCTRAVRRRVLDELDQLVAKDDAARRHGEIAADLERALVAHRNAAAPRIGDEIGEPLHEARTVGGERALQHLGIGRHEIRRRERIDVLLRQEREPSLVLLRAARRAWRARPGIRRRAGSPASTARSTAARATRAARNGDRRQRDARRPALALRLVRRGRVPPSPPSRAPAIAPGIWR